jgi:UPF0755 protein
MSGGRTAFWLLAGVLVLLLAAAEVQHELGTPLRGWAEPETVRVAPGETLADVLRDLRDRGLLRESPMVEWWARLRGWDRRVRAGRYLLGANQSAMEILRTLVEGPRLLEEVTLPEGLRLEEALEILARRLDLPVDSLRAAARDSAWLRSLGLPRPSLEGYLFPDTYRFDTGTPARAVLAHLVRQTLAFFTPERRRRADSLGLTIHEVVTLASIIQAEARWTDEMPRISAVFHNRLRRGWLLQADPTVLYAVGKVGQPPTTRDLQVDSPYNTYLRPGLPPGPINSPGRAALEAALHPLEGCRDLYFVAGPDGRHVFSRTLAEHEKARWRLRKMKTSVPRSR